MTIAVDTWQVAWLPSRRIGRRSHRCPARLKILGSLQVHRRAVVGWTALAYGAAWDMRGKRWKPYYEDNSEQRLTAPVSRIYQVRSMNATGFVRTTDQIDGEEVQRVRFIASAYLMAIRRYAAMVSR